MPVHKGIDYLVLKNSIKSCLNNSILPKQFLIIINGSLDQQKKLYLIDLKKKYKNIEIIYCDKIGIHNALNLGIKNTKFNTIIRADADDYNVTKRFEKQLYFFKKNNLDILGCENLETYNQKFIYKKKITKDPKIINFIVRNPINHMTTVFKKDKIVLLGGYPNIPYKEDYALWFKAYLFDFKIKNMNEPLVYTNINKKFFKRRKNLISLVSEIKLVVFLIKINYLIGFLMIFICLLRSLILLLPDRIFKYIYKFILRKKIIK